MASASTKGNKDASHSSNLTEENYNAAAAAYYSSTNLPVLTTSSSTVFQCPTLSSFLKRFNLTQYCDLFDDAGVGENDLGQLASFDEEELKEVLAAIPMKPFHSTAFKKGIRELRQSMSVNIQSLPTTSFQPPPIAVPTMPPYTAATLAQPPNTIVHPMTTRKKAKIAPASTPSTIVSHSESQPPIQSQEQPSSIPSNSVPFTNNPTVPRDIIIHHATIYGKNSNRQLTQYEQAINQAAIELALANPALVANKGALFEKAKAKLLQEGYTYKRGASRSKLNPHAPKPGQRASRDLLRQRRNANAAMTSESRNLRISELEQKLEAKDIQYELAQESKRTKLEQRDNMGADKAQSAILELEKERNDIVKELSCLKGKERKHQWYEKKKKERMDSGFEEGVDDMLNEEDESMVESEEPVSSLVGAGALLNNDVVKAAAEYITFIPEDQDVRKESSQVQHDNHNRSINGID